MGQVTHFLFHIIDFGIGCESYQPIVWCHHKQQQALQLNLPTEWLLATLLQNQTRTINLACFVNRFSFA